MLAIAMIVRLEVLWSRRFDGLYGQDAYAYYYHGLALWRNHALSYHWPWLPAPLRLYWPIGEPALVAVAMAIAGHPSALAAQSVSVVAGLGVVALTYLLTLRVATHVLPVSWTTWTAALAAMLIALSGLEVQAGGTIMADAPALCWGSAAVWFWTTPSGGKITRHPVPLGGAAGICFALAVSTRFEYAPLAAAPALYWAARRSQGGTPSALAALGGAILAGTPQMLYSLSYSDPVLHQQWLTGWGLEHLWQTDFATQDGAQHYPMSAGAFYLLRPLISPQSLPLTLAPFLLVGIVILYVGTYNAWTNGQLAPTSRPLLLLLLAWWLVPALYLSGVPFESARFALIFAPPLAVLEAVGLAGAVYWLPVGRRRVLPAVFMLVGLSLGILVVDAPRPLGALASGKAGDLAAVRWLNLHAPPGAVLVTFGLTLTLYHYGDSQDRRWTLVDLSSATTGDLRGLARTYPLVVVANEANLAEQWAGLPPEKALQWLLGHARLRPVARIGGYTIRER